MMSKQQQQQFFDRAFSDDIRKPVRAFYAINKPSVEFYRNYLLAHAPGRRVLEYGCGKGSSAFFLAGEGAQHVTGIDISGVGIEQARARAREEGLENTTFYVMDAEAMDFEANQFDLVCGTGIMHHLQLEKALAGLTRVLTAEGSAIFVEPMGYNPAINLFRRLTPSLRVEDERPLRKRDLDLIAAHFNRVDLYFYHLLTLLAVPFRKTRWFESLLGALNTLDRKLLDRIPGLGLLAWQVVIVAHGPKQNGT